MARAEIAQTFDTDGNCLSLTMTIDCDVLDSPDLLDEAVKRAVVLWHCVQDSE